MQIVDHKTPGLGAVRSKVLLRNPATLMRPERLAAMQPSRLSASRALIAQAARGKWSIRIRNFDIDLSGRGQATYQIDAEGWTFSFVAHSFPPSRKGRTGRIIGTAWDMMGSLIEGAVDKADVELIGQEMPLLYHGRAAPRTLIWCRSNRSGRAFDETVSALAAGRQPLLEPLLKANYVMRNTGLDGNGTFGTRSFLALEADHPLRSSLRAQMLTAYMMRVFALDFVNHLARLAGGAQAVELDERIARYLGVGNGSALGLMFYVNNHPRLIDRWLRAQEQALAAAKQTTFSDGDANARTLLKLLDKAVVYRSQDSSAYDVLEQSRDIASDLRGVRGELARLLKGAGQLSLIDFCESLDGHYSAAAIETFNSALIELVPDLADRLAGDLVVDEELVGLPEMTAARLRDVIHADYGWAFRMDLESDRSRRFVWYKSANAEEPRRGDRNEVPDDAYNLALDVPRLIVRFERVLADFDPKTPVARVLLAHPEFRRIATRVQGLHGLPYHTPHADIMSEDFIPAFVTRLLNGPIHGLDKTEDAMERVLRGVLMQGAPLVHELADGSADPHWFHPAEPIL